MKNVSPAVQRTAGEIEILPVRAEGQRPENLGFARHNLGLRTRGDLLHDEGVLVAVAFRVRHVPSVQ